MTIVTFYCIWIGMSLVRELGMKLQIGYLLICLSEPVGYDADNR